MFKDVLWGNADIQNQKKSHLVEVKKGHPVKVKNEKFMLFNGDLHFHISNDINMMNKISM